MFRFTVIVFDLQLVIRVTVLRNAEILVVAQTENHVEDGADENQTNRETNTLTKSNRFLVLGDDVNDYTGNDEQCAEQRDKAEQAQNERDQKEPAVAPINLERDLTPPTIEIVGFLGGAARFITKPCLKQRVMRFPTVRYGCSV